MAASEAPSSIVLAGAPSALEGVVPVPAAQRKSIRFVIEEDDGRITPRVLTSPIGVDSTLVRIVTPDTTPPGRYHGRLVSDSGEIGVTVEVGAQPLLVLLPDTLIFRCPPGGTDRIRLAISNLGNVRFAPRRDYAMGLLEEGAIETAIGIGLRMSPRPPGDSRVERFGDALAERYGGLAWLRITDMGEAVEPGQTVAAAAELRLDKEAKPGRKYHGLWEPEGAKVSLAVESTEAEPAENRAPRPRRRADASTNE